jgi:hypothetical protein
MGAAATCDEESVWTCRSPSAGRDVDQHRDCREGQRGVVHWFLSARPGSVWPIAGGTVLAFRMVRVTQTLLIGSGVDRVPDDLSSTWAAQPMGRVNPVWGTVRDVSARRARRSEFLALQNKAEMRACDQAGMN